MSISKELLKILVCPKCKEGMRLDELKNSLICDKCKLAYHIKDDIPVMFIEESEKIRE